MDGFTKNRPIPGMSGKAYSDAEGMYRDWRTMQKLWNSVMDAPKKPDPDKLEGIIAATERPTVAFLYDLLEAWAYIMDKKVCFGIPWPGSRDRVEKLIPTTDSLLIVRKQLLQKANACREDFRLFDRQFLGVPDSMIQDALQTASTRSLGLSEMISTEARVSGAFGELLKKTARKRRGGAVPKGRRSQAGRRSTSSKAPSTAAKRRKKPRSSATVSHRAPKS